MKKKELPSRVAQRAEEPRSPGFMDMDITFYLQEDGRVVITDLPEELLDLVKKLDPRAEIFCAFDNPVEKK